jgi:hypothetical protein
MPGLLRGVARVAVVSGTATAVSGRVQRRQAARFTEQDAATAASRTDADYAAQAAQPAPAAAAAAPPDDMLDQLKQLGDLKAQGILTEAEFEAQKARILGG